MDSPHRKLHESASLFNLFSDLSPLKSVKPPQHSSQGFPLANFSSPPSVFRSPRMEDRGGQSCPKSREMDAANSQYRVQSDIRVENVQNIQEEQTLSPSEYLAADPPDLEVNSKSSVLCGIQQNDMQQDTITNVNDNMESEQYASQSVETHNKTGESSRITSKASFKEFYQRHSNVSRHLHFGATMGYNETHDSANSSLTGANPHVQITVPHQNEPSRTTSSLHAGASITSLSTSCPAESFEPTQIYVHGKSVRIPYRFGLPFGGNQNAQEEMQWKDLDGASNSSAAATSDFYARLGDHQQESHASATVGSSDYPIMTPPSDSLFLTPYDHPYEAKMLMSPNTSTVEETNKESPKRNRKRGKDLADTDGCKHCNCKRSKCLKLYCECFAAGVYCLDTCACENCFNRPEYEDTVLDTRQQIETRNPLAFAPKVYKPTTSIPANMIEETPSSARHKRGCNCKKSKCLKKYCECYQAGVGCYNGCRCEDCNNCFGRKAESIYRRMEKWESPSSEVMDVSGAHRDFIDTGHAHQFPPSKWEEFPNISLTPSSNQSNVSQKGSSLQSSSAIDHQYSSDGFTPMLLGRKVLSEINSDRIFYNILEGADSIPNTSTPLKPVQASSKHLSPLQIRAQDMSSSSGHGLKSVRKLTLPPSPLTPYSHLESGEPRIDEDMKETNSHF